MRPAHGRAALLAVLAATPGLVVAVATGAQQDGLAPGADLADCLSALRVGPVACAQPLPSGSAVAGSWPDASPVDPIEARIDAFLAQYGKPPREAVRALLDPSDDNIRRYLRQHQETLAVAAYVAARMTALQAAADPAPGVGPPMPDLPSYLQMRVTVLTAPGDRQSAGALHALRELARRVPALQSVVQLTGAMAPQQLRAEVARIEPPLTATVAADADDPGTLPLVRIDDLRNRQTLTIDARNLTPQGLSAAIVALRRAAPAAGPSAPPADRAGAPR